MLQFEYYLHANGRLWLVGPCRWGGTSVSLGIKARVGVLEGRWKRVWVWLYGVCCASLFILENAQCFGSTACL